MKRGLEQELEDVVAKLRAASGSRTLVLSALREFEARIWVEAASLVGEWVHNYHPTIPIERIQQLQRIWRFRAAGGTRPYCPVCKELLPWPADGYAVIDTYPQQVPMTCPCGWKGLIELPAE